jgi:hypothetical protein
MIQAAAEQRWPAPLLVTQTVIWSGQVESLGKAEREIQTSSGELNLQLSD